MSRLAVWVANGVLFVLGCYLAANIVNEAAAAWLAAPPSAVVTATPKTEAARKHGRDPRIILKRNLFNASVLAPASDVSADENLEATKLPLRLLGTVASPNVKLAWAAVENLKDHHHLVVHVNDSLLDRARVVRIERRRIVLENGSRREELVLQDDQGGAGGSRGGGGNGSAASGDGTYNVSRSAIRSFSRNPAALFSQARILPKYQHGQMVGVQLNAIKPGSLFANIGLQNGDTITELNGIDITSPEKSASVLRQLTQANHFDVVVKGPDGNERTLNYEVGQ